MKKLGLSIVLLTLCFVARDAAAQSNWAEKLGFAPGTRAVVLHANDLGVMYGCSRPIEQAMADGRLTSASFVAPGPWFPECADWAKSHPDLDLGISLCFVCPSRMIRWGVVAPPTQVSSLVTVDGYMHAAVPHFASRAELKDVRREAESQILRARAFGMPPSHLHPHLGAMLTRADLLGLYLDLAEEYRIPAVMVELTPRVVNRFREAGFEFDDEMLQQVARYPLPKLDDIRNVPAANSYEEKRNQFYKIIQQLEPGITQIFLIPADDTPAVQRASSTWQQRVWESRLLTDPEVSQYLSKERIQLTNWREIMRRFEAASKDTSDNE